MENQKPASDEIDITQLFAKIADFFKSIGLGVIKFLALLRNTPGQNKLLFASLILLGGLIGLGYSSLLKKKFYESSMILSSDYLNKRIVDNAIDKLTLLAEEETPQGLARALHVSDTLASNIVRFDAKPFVAERELVELEVLKEQLKNAQVKSPAVIDQIIKRIEIENQHGFEFTVRTYSQTAIKPLQDALVSYFKNNDYIKRRVDIEKVNLGARKTKLLRESQKLDSLKSVIYANYRSMADQTRQGSNNVILSDKAVTNPLDVYAQDLDLYDQLLVINRKLYLQPDFEIIDGFTEFDEPASASKLRIVATGILIGFLFGYVVVALRRLDHFLSEI